jgi:hypothetical protein
MKSLLWRELCGGSDFSARSMRRFRAEGQKGNKPPASRRGGSFRTSDASQLRPAR